MREKHLFQFTGARISACAMDERNYHLDRVIFWKEEQDRVAEQLRGTAIEIREYQVTGGKRLQAVIDMSLTSRLSECGEKIASHQKAADEFGVHAGAYGANPDRRFELEPQDVIYFRLAGGERPE